MKYIVAISLLSCFLILSCKKEPQPQSSMMNADSIITDSITPAPQDTMITIPPDSLSTQDSMLMRK
ncbi:hypothetical protein [Chryseobacterium sp.]|uniref:hypothetical protein n=1 Tax=Chryseobacterium sp. TaxID=1871047 RepID=UPI0025C4502C|nr:hypothetical protein [Chryseobacterium sp.]